MEVAVDYGKGIIKTEKVEDVVEKLIKFKDKKIQYKDFTLEIVFNHDHFNGYLHPNKKIAIKNSFEGEYGNVCNENTKIPHGGFTCTNYGFDCFHAYDIPIPIHFFCKNYNLPIEQKEFEITEDNLEKFYCHFKGIMAYHRLLPKLVENTFEKKSTFKSENFVIEELKNLANSLIEKTIL